MKIFKVILIVFIFTLSTFSMAQHNYHHHKNRNHGHYSWSQGKGSYTWSGKKVGHKKWNYKSRSCWKGKCSDNEFITNERPW